MSDLPSDARPVTTEELLQCIGELFVQTRILQRLLAERSQELIRQDGHVPVQP